MLTNNIHEQKVKLILLNANFHKVDIALDYPQFIRIYT